MVAPDLVRGYTAEEMVSKQPQPYRTALLFAGRYFGFYHGAINSRVPYDQRVSWKTVKKLMIAFAQDHYVISN